MTIAKRQDSPFGDAAARALGDAAGLNEVFSPRNARLTEVESSETGIPRAEDMKTQGLFRSIGIEEIAFCRFQTRDISDEHELLGLAKSIKQRGVLQPILVRSTAKNQEGGKPFELVAGERRLRAARLAGLETVPAVIYDMDDRETLEAAVIENAQREDLNPVEEALGYLSLVEEFGFNQTEVARAIGKNRATVSNALRLLHLAPEVIELLKSGELSAGHGRALLMLEDSELQQKFAKRCVQNGFSVRALERAVSKYLESEVDTELSEEEEKALASLGRQQTKVSNFLGLEDVSLRYDSQGKKRLNLVFDTEASWRRFMAKIRE